MFVSVVLCVVHTHLTFRPLLALLVQANPTYFTFFSVSSWPVLVFKVKLDPIQFLARDELLIHVTICPGFPQRQNIT